MYDELIKRLRERSVFLFPHHGESRSYDADLMHEAADAIEELNVVVRAQKAVLDKFPKWIPVTERLPEHGWYLVYGPTIKMEVLHYHSAEEVWSSKRYYNIEVTHWMPLPEPPKEE